MPELDVRAAALHEAFLRRVHGASLDEALDTAPELRAELLPLLAAASVLVEHGPEPAAGFVEHLAHHLRAQMRSETEAAGAVPIAPSARGFWLGAVGARLAGRRSRPVLLRMAFGTAAILLMLGGLTVAAAAGSRPGDPLYRLRERLEAGGLLAPVPTAAAQPTPETPMAVTPVPTATDDVTATPRNASGDAAAKRKPTATRTSTTTATPTMTASPTASPTPTLPATAPGEPGDGSYQPTAAPAEPGQPTDAAPDPTEPPPPYPGPP